MSTGLPRQDNVWITTKQLVRFHKKKFDEMLCKSDSSEFAGSFRRTKPDPALTLRFWNILQKWLIWTIFGENNNIKISDPWSSRWKLSYSCFFICAIWSPFKFWHLSVSRSLQSVDRLSLQHLVRRCIVFTRFFCWKIRRKLRSRKVDDQVFHLVERVCSTELLWNPSIYGSLFDESARNSLKSLSTEGYARDCQGGL